MRKLLLILILLQTVELFSQNSIQLYLDSNSRSVPEVGFSANTIRGPSWVDSIFNDSVATMCPKILRHPPGAAPFLDWETGWFYPQSVLDTAIIDTVYTMNAGWYNLDTLDLRPIRFQEALNQIGAEGLFLLNMMSSNVYIQAAALRSAVNDGVIIKRVELGSEINRTNIFDILKYPTAGDYARTCNHYIDSIKVILPEAEIAVVGGNRAPDSSRSWRWNDSIYSIVDSADALVWHPYIYLKDEDTTFTYKQVLAYPFYRIPLIEKWRAFNDTVAALQEYELWITEYNLYDKTYDKRYTNTWAHILMLAGMNNILMRNSLVEMLLLHNLGGIFTNFDALDTENSFRKQGTGIFAYILYNSMHNMTSATPINTPSNLIDSVDYQNSNGVINEISFPKLFGWKFNNSTEESLILTNISSDTLVVSVSSIFSGDVYWNKWSSDSLFAQIDSVTHINIDNDSSKVDAIILPYSINIVSSTLCIPSVNTQNVTICEYDSVTIGSNSYFYSGTYVDSFTTLANCDSVIVTNLLVSPQLNSSIVQIGDTLSASLVGTSEENSYYWNTEETTANITPLEDGVYWVLIEDLNGCISDTCFYNLFSTPNQIPLESEKQELQIIDILGRNSHYQYNNILFFIYDDGTVRKKIIVD